MNEGNNKKSESIGAVFAILGGALWGLSGVSAQYLFNYRGFEAPWLVTVRLIIGGALVLLSCLVSTERSGAVRRIWTNAADAVVLLFFSIVGIGACQFTYFSAVQASNAGAATVLSYTAPVIIMLYISVTSRKLPASSELLALVLAVGGTFLLATRGDIETLAISEAGLAWGILSALTLASYTLIPVRLMKVYGTLPVLGWGMLISGVFLTIFTKPWNFTGSLDANAVLAFLAVILFGTILAFAFYLEGVRRIGAPKASLFSASEPLTATIATTVFMGTEFLFMDFLGLVMILFAVALLSISGAAKNRKA